MASYLQKLRRQSKQVEPHEPVTSPPAPTVSSPSEEPGSEPVLDEEDQKFIERLAAIAREPEGTPPPLPTRPVEVIDNGEKKVGKDAQDALMDGAHTVPLPMSPPGVPGDEAGTEKGKTGELGRKKSVLSYFSVPARFKKAEKDKEKEKVSKDKKQEKITGKDRAKAADDLLLAAEAAKSSSQDEIKKEEQDLTEILDQLNLSAVNNRVFSFSKESEELLNQFKLVLKDIVNGAPTAYNDLEKLFTDYEGQLKKMYGSLPPFLQNLVKSLPSKLTATLGPELMAAQSEKPGFDAKTAAAFGEKVKAKARIPTVKELVSVQGAIATMLRSILNFLKLRFPALVTGTNAIMSLAVFLLLFVLWYCHKRGRETRLEQERLASEGGDSGSSSITEDNDSIFGDKPKSKSKQKETGESKAKEEEKAQPPLIISDNKEPPELPSVLHLPDPKTVPLPEPSGDTPAKETPGSK